MRARRHPVDAQADLFTPTPGDLFPVRRPIETSRPLDLGLRVKSAMAKALKACPDSTAIVAARISEMLGRELTADALYAFTAPSKTDHDIGITRFIAFVRATKAWWLWDLLVEDDGLVVLEGREAKLAQLGALHQKKVLIEDMTAELQRELGRDPVTIGKRRGGR